MCPADFRFSQDENDGAAVEAGRGSSKNSAWVSTLVDCLNVSTTNSTAFSPTDTMPLSSRAKVLTVLASICALVLSVIVIDHGVGSLKCPFFTAPTTLAVGPVLGDGGGDRSAQHIGQLGHGGNHLPRR